MQVKYKTINELGKALYRLQHKYLGQKLFKIKSV